MPPPKHHLLYLGADSEFPDYGTLPLTFPITPSPSGHPGCKFLAALVWLSMAIGCGLRFAWPSAQSNKQQLIVFRNVLWLFYRFCFVLQRHLIPIIIIT